MSETEREKEREKERNRKEVGDRKRMTDRSKEISLLCESQQCSIDHPPAALLGGESPP